jgi:DNA-binding beta-propeller fold protein YncE
MRILLAAALLFSAQAALAQPVPWPRAVTDFASPAETEAVAAQFPNSSNMQRRRLAAALDAHDASAALDATRRLAAMGATLSPASRARVAALVGEGPIATLAPAFDANAAPAGESRAYAGIGTGQRLIEGLIWDGGGHRLYATSVVDRRLLELREDGAHVLAEGGLGSLFGGAWDPARSRLWIAAALIDQTPDGLGFAGLLGVDPADPRHPQRIPAPAGGTPGDVAVAPDGIVYVSDGLNGAVYRCRPGCTALETWLPPHTFLSAQGMTVSADGRLLYVADYRYGLAAVERSSGRVFRMAAPPELMLDGIDGLIRDHDRLIAIQNGAPPLRIVQLSLSGDGLGITSLRVVERLNPAWGEPSLGAVAGDRLLYVSNPQWERYGAGGAVIGEGPLRPTVIREVRLPPRSR